jgi:hypothetical protein
MIGHCDLSEQTGEGGTRGLVSKTVNPIRLGGDNNW